MHAVVKDAIVIDVLNPVATIHRATGRRENPAAQGLKVKIRA